ncbi:hypothetical protein [Actinoplanes sp. NPDC026623]
MVWNLLVVSTVIVAAPAGAVGMSACRDSWYGVPASPVAGLVNQLPLFGS